MFGTSRKASFENFSGNGYDPRQNSYDPRMNRADGDGGAGYAVQGAKPGNKMQVNLSLTNATASNLTFEIWNYLDSFMRKKKNDYVTGNYLYIPQLSREGILAVATNTALGVVGFDQLGNLIINGDNNDPVGTLNCKEIPYAAFFEASGITPFRISGIRLTFTNAASIDQEIVYRKKTYSGGLTENRINPRSYFRPNQFQDLIVDLPVELDIANDSGLVTEVLAGQTLKMSLFIQQWTVPALG